MIGDFEGLLEVREFRRAAVAGMGTVEMRSNSGSRPHRIVIFDVIDRDWFIAAQINPERGKGPSPYHYASRNNYGREH